MSHLAGIIYPNVFQVTELLSSMCAIFGEQQNDARYRYKNLELGSWQSPLASNERKNLWALIDGSIYNASSLREELRQISGFAFPAQSDAELLVHAYSTWGEGCLSHLKGPFALAIFDEEKEMLLLARDRLGQKPLYWTAHGGYWLFSTQLKGLLSTGIIPQTPSRDAIAAYLYFGYIPQDLAPVHGVNKLLPGHFMKVDLSRQSMIGQYWSYSRVLNEKRICHQSEVYHQLGHHLEAAVGEALPKEGMLGSALMGNLGSSALAWFSSHQRERKQLQTFTAIFDEPEPSELEMAKAVTQELSLQHEMETITVESLFNELPQVIWHLDEPVADPYVMQTWELGKMASKTCSAMIVDAGWEELFAGNPRYFATHEGELSPPLAFYLAKCSPRIRHHLILPALHLLHSRLKYRILRNIDIDREQVHYLMDTALFKGRSRKKVSPFLFPAFDPEVFTQRFHRLSSLPGEITPLLYYDAKTHLPDCLLLQYERLFLPHGVRVIAPYLDHEMFEFLARVPEAIKFEGKIPGAILHNLLEYLCHACPKFPERKPTFLERWCHHPKFREIFTLLEKGRLVEEGWISPKWIRQQLGYPYLIPRTLYQLWSLLVLELWFEMFISRPISSTSQHCSIQELLGEAYLNV